MPRKHREEVAGGIFHVYARGNDKRLIYSDDADRGVYLRLLSATVGRCRWRLLAFCLMQNHVHLLIETPDANLGTGMQRLHSDYAQQFNQRHGRSGHVFQGRYGAVSVSSDEQLWGVAAYLAMNPVKAGLCDTPEEWPWSSHAATVRGAGPAWLDDARLLFHFEGLGGDPRERYAAMFRG
jgi:REP-associated tyrosine transposase